MTGSPLIFFSPLPPQRNGIADYSDSLLAPLSKRYSITAVVADDAPTTVSPHCDTITYSEYVHYSQSLASLPHAYQVGNNFDHCYMLPMLASIPGLVTIHDLSLQHMLGSSLPGGPVGEGYSQLMFEAYGRAGVLVSRDIKQWGWQSSIVHSEMGLTPALVSRASGVVTHSLTGKLRLAATGMDVPIFHIPHPYQERVEPIAADRDAAKRRARIKLGLPTDKVVLLSLGFVTRAKRIDLTFKVMQQFMAKNLDVLFVVAGQTNKDEFDLDGEIARLDLRDHVITRGYVPDDAMLEYLAACDVLVNLRYPTLGESSGSLANGLGVGCCIVVTDVGTFSEVPDSCAVKVPVEHMTPSGLMEALLPLVCFPALRAAYEAASRKFAVEQLQMNQFVDRYVEALETVFPNGRSSYATRQLDSQTVTLAPVARSQVDAAANQLSVRPSTGHNLWWHGLMLPAAQSPDKWLHIIGGNAFEAELARDAFGWANVRNYALTQISDVARCDVLMALSSFDEFADDASTLLAAAANALPSNASFVVSLVGEASCTSKHLVNRPAMADLFLRYGFRVVQDVGNPTEIWDSMWEQDSDPERVILAIKGSDVLWDSSHRIGSRSIQKDLTTC
ncbi:glycosyltransferase [Sphingobium sp.]|uniref:glycosyltransferase n=1 Tax=Sphingobium sp. TaxID=1912891 RepID=UPI003BB49B34